MSPKVALPFPLEEVYLIRSVTGIDRKNPVVIDIAGL